MLLAAAILSSIGGLLILAGSFVQLKRGYGSYARRGEIEVWVGKDGKTLDLTGRIPQLGTYERVAVYTEGHYELGDDSDYTLPPNWTPRTGLTRTYAGVNGWNLILVGGAFVLAGSVIMAISAATT